MYQTDSFEPFGKSSIVRTLLLRTESTAKYGQYVPSGQNRSVRAVLFRKDSIAPYGQY